MKIHPDPGRDHGEEPTPDRLFPLLYTTTRRSAARGSAIRCGLDFFSAAYCAKIYCGNALSMLKMTVE
jgi:hypothetical protein